MDVREIFNNLITNKFMKVFDYMTRFSFRTVSYYGPYSYRSCRCGVEHEFVDYINVNGDTDSEMFETIVQSIIEDKCPHVNDKVSDEWVKVTSVTALHIAIATETPKVLNLIDKQSINTVTSIFGVQLPSIALNKKKLRYFMRCLHIKEPKTLCLLIKLTQGKAYSTIISRKSLIESLVQAREETMLKRILKSTSYTDNLNGAFQYTLKYDLVEMQNILLKKMSKMKSTDFANLVISTIMYNKAETLEKLLSFKSVECELRERCSTICKLLQRNQCKVILFKYNLFQNNDIVSTGFKRRLLVDLLIYEDFWSEVLEALQEISEIREQGAQKFEKKAYHICPPNVFATPVGVIKELLFVMADLSCYYYDGNFCQCPDQIWKLNRNVPAGWFIEHTYREEGINWLMHLINAWGLHHMEVRELIKSLIENNHQLEDENLNLKSWVVKLGLELDLRNTTSYELADIRYERRINHLFHFDDKEHGLFGHDAENFALNFEGPILLECGFPVDKSTLDIYLKKSLHPAENAYLLEYKHRTFEISGRVHLEIFRETHLVGHLQRFGPLLYMCRDVLRKHFRGRAL